MYEPGYDGGGVGLVAWLFFLAIYCYVSYAQYKIAQKVGCSDQAWWAWIPILGLFLLAKMAGKPWYWALLCVIPIICLAAWALMWVEVAKSAGHSGVWGVLMLIPFLSFVAIGVMAFSGGPTQGSLPTSDQVDSRTPTPVG